MKAIHYVIVTESRAKVIGILAESKKEAVAEVCAAYANNIFKLLQGDEAGLDNRVMIEDITEDYEQDGSELVIT